MFKKLNRECTVWPLAKQCKQPQRITKRYGTRGCIIDLFASGDVRRIVFHKNNG